MTADLGDTIQNIRAIHRERVFAMEQRKKLDLAFGSYLRLLLGWRKDAPADERKRVNDRSKALMAYFERLFAPPIVDKRTGKERPRKVPEPIDDPLVDPLMQMAGAHYGARLAFSELEDARTVEMEKLAETLPVWPLLEPIRGFSSRGLATIVAEAGDLSRWPEGNPMTVSQLWKRVGVAVLDGTRQGGLKKTAAKDDWIAHGYNRKRRSFMFVIGENLVKNNGDDGYYRKLYIQRHFDEVAKAEAEGLIVATTQNATVESWQKRGLPLPVKITEGELKKHPEKYRTAGHIANRAKRYMEKRLLRNVWQAWREAMGCVMPTQKLPPADHPQEDRHAA